MKSNTCLRIYNNMIEGRLKNFFLIENRKSGMVRMDKRRVDWGRLWWGGGGKKTKKTDDEGSGTDKKRERRGEE